MHNICSNVPLLVHLFYVRVMPNSYLICQTNPVYFPFYFVSFFQALQSNLRYSLLPKRLTIGKRLAQCLHPALPSGVHLKALETYEVIFKIIGTKWLAKDLFIYR